MAWYTSHELRFRGRLVRVGSRYGCLDSARVLKGKPLDLRYEESRDWKRLAKIFYRNKKVQEEISDFLEALSEDS